MVQHTVQTHKITKYPENPAQYLFESSNLCYHAMYTAQSLPT